jgi:predicted permease
MTFTLEIKKAFRFLRFNPVFAIVATVSLGLGIGFATTIFTCMEGVLLTPISGAADNAGLGLVWGADQEGDLSALSYPDFKDLRKGVTKMTGLAGHVMSTVSVSGNGKPDRQWALCVSGNFFDVLQTSAARGRLLSGSDETTAGANPVAVISYSYWQGAFGGDPRIVGRNIAINKQPFTIVGVARPDFFGPYTGLSFNLYIPLTMLDQLDPVRKRLADRNAGFISAIGRLRPGATHQEAAAELSILSQQLTAENNGARGRFSIAVFKLWNSPVGTQAVLGPVLTAMTGLEIFILLIVCLNIATLMLVRSDAARRDGAIRLALGARRWNLARPFLAESLILALLGGTFGIFAARAALAAVPLLAPSIGLPLSLNFPIRWPSVAVNFCIALMVGLTCSLLPAWYTSRLETATVLREVGAGIAGSQRGSRWRSVLSVGQIALSFTMIVCGGLLLRSVQRAQHADLGFNPAGVEIASIDLATSSFQEEAGQRFYSRLLDELRSAPGSRSVALARSVPLGFSGNDRIDFFPEGYQPKTNETMTAWANEVTSEYFATMAIPLLRGRGFTERDTAAAPFVAVVNEAMARQYWPGRDCIGQKFRSGKNVVQIVGVVKNAKLSSLNRDAIPYAFVPLGQFYRPRVSIHVRSQESPGAVFATIHSTVARLDPEIPIFEEKTLDQQVGAALFPQHLAMVLLGFFGLFGVQLTAIGIYGTLAQTVKDRRKEIGVRVALGATPGKIRNLVLRRALRFIAIGLGIGFVLSSIASFTLASIFAGIQRLDPLSFGVGMLLILVTVLAAAYLPARHAAGLDPLASLRSG